MAPGGRPVEASLRRVQRALLAYRQGVAPWIVASGGRRWHGVAEAEAYRHFLLEEGVAPESVVMELCSLSTVENAAYVAELCAERAWQRVALVTCDWHAPRALWCFERVGLSCVCLPAASPKGSLWKQLGRSLRERLSLKLEREWRAHF